MLNTVKSSGAAIQNKHSIYSSTFCTRSSSSGSKGAAACPSMHWVRGSTDRQTDNTTHVKFSQRHTENRTVKSTVTSTASAADWLIYIPATLRSLSPASTQPHARLLFSGGCVTPSTDSRAELGLLEVHYSLRMSTHPLNISTILHHECFPKGVHTKPVFIILLVVRSVLFSQRFPFWMRGNNLSRIIGNNKEENNLSKIPCVHPYLPFLAPHMRIWCLVNWTSSGFCFACQTQQDIWRCHCGLWEIMTRI